MKWLAKLFRRQSTASDDPTMPTEPGHSATAATASVAGEPKNDDAVGNFVEQNPAKFEAAAEIYFTHDCNGEAAYPALKELGLDQIEILRLTGLVPVICGREMFSGRPDSPQYSSFYVVTNFGRTRVEVPYETCAVCEGIRRAIRSISRAQLVLVGAMACETQSINDALNQAQQQGLTPEMSKVVLYPTELEC